MLNWLAKKSLLSRIYMCTKEVKWDIENIDPHGAARILLHTTDVRISLSNPIPVLMDMLDEPFLFGFDDIAHMYVDIETSRNESSNQLDQMKRRLKQLGISDPKFAEKIGKPRIRALEVIMCTIGCGIDLKRREDIVLIWGKLMNAIDYLPDVANELRIFESSGNLSSSQEFATPILYASDEVMRAAASFVPRFVLALR